MSQTVDTNVLVYASHTGSPFHERARALVEHLVAGPSLAYFLWPAVVGYLRIVTHPAILGTPLSTDEAISNVEAVLAPSHVRVAGEGDDFWTSFRRVAADVKPRGNLVPDAHLVALDAGTWGVDDLEPRPRPPQVQRHHGEGPLLRRVFDRLRLSAVPQSQKAGVGPGARIAVAGRTAPGIMAGWRVSAAAAASCWRATTGCGWSPIRATRSSTRAARQGRRWWWGRRRPPAPRSTAPDGTPEGSSPAADPSSPPPASRSERFGPPASKGVPNPVGTRCWPRSRSSGARACTGSASRPPCWWRCSGCGPPSGWGRPPSTGSPSTSSRPYGWR